MEKSLLPLPENPSKALQPLYSSEYVHYLDAPQEMSLMPMQPMSENMPPEVIAWMQHYHSEMQRREQYIDFRLIIHERKLQQLSLQIAEQARMRAEEWTRLPAVVLSKDVTIYSPPSSSYFKNRRIVQRTPLVPEDIGINSDFFHRRGIHQLSGWIEPTVNGTLKVEFDLILFSELNSSWLGVVNRLKDIAKANQARTLHFEAEIVNEKLLNVMTKRYGEPIIKSVTTEYETVSKQVFLIPVE